MKITMKMSMTMSMTSTFSLEFKPYYTTIFPMKTPETRLNTLFNTLLLTLSGLLLGIGFAPTRLGFLVYVGFIPLLIVLERGIAENTGIMRTLGRLYWAFFVFHGVSNWWVSSWQREADPYLMIAGVALWLGHPFFFALPMLAYRALRRKFGRASALLFLPALWTAFEWAHGLGELSYPWQSLGYTQAYYTPVLQIADIAGVWGLTFVIVLTNACLAEVYFIFVEMNARESRATRITKTLYLCRSYVVLVLGILLTSLGYGLWQMRTFDHTHLLATNPAATIGIVQPNINPWGKWGGSAQEQVLLHVALQDSLRKELRKATPNTRLDAVLWSETAITYRILTPQNYPYLEQLHAWTDSTKTAILTGLPSDILYKSRADAPITASVVPRLFDTLYMDSFNSAMLLAPASRIIPDSIPSPYPSDIQIHRKMRLTPFAERVPYSEVFSFAVKALTWGVGISGWGLGKEQKTLNFVRYSGDSPVQRTSGGNDTVRVGMIICLESIYSRFVSEYPAKGANVLAVITNDGWFNGTPGPEQHYMIAVMRAVETRRYLARCGNTGISGFITPLGLSLQQTQLCEQTALAARLPLLNHQTPYVLLGDWLPMLCTLLGFLALTSIFFYKTSPEQP
jgi:apolipoprotein N-acyltransferase